MHRIKELIKERGYTMTAFAQSLGVHRTTFYEMLESPSYATLVRIAKQLKVPMWMLFATKEDVLGYKDETMVCPHCHTRFEEQK